MENEMALTEAYDQLKALMEKQKISSRLLNLQLGIPVSIQNNTIKLSKEEFRNRLTKRGNSASQIMHAIADGISLETIGENLIWPLNAEETKELLLSLNLIKLEEDY